MGVQTSEVGYTCAMPRREDHEVHKGHVVVLGGEVFGESQVQFCYVQRNKRITFLTSLLTNRIV